MKTEFASARGVEVVRAAFGCLLSPGLRLHSASVTFNASVARGMFDGLGAPSRPVLSGKRL